MRQAHYHFIGIGGIGMSALAFILLRRGERVSGSDRKESAMTQKLSEMGAEIYLSQDSDHIKPSQIVVYSTAIKEDNPEYARARELGCLMWHRSDLLRCLSLDSRELVVAGAHGKTTTSAILAHVLTSAGLDPSFALGGTSDSLPTHGYLGKGEHFVIEGDESDGSFLKTSPFGAILTNIDADHLDFWGTQDALYHAYVNFLLSVKDKQLLFWCADDPFLRALNLEGVGFGTSEHASLRAKNIRELPQGTIFDIYFEDEAYLNVTLPVIGRHNVLNALGVFGLSLRLGIHEEKIRTALKLFKGVKRRLEVKGEIDGVTIVDDYAHHPSEIEATLNAIQPMAKNRNLHVVFQPHRFSRILTLKEAFTSAFRKADNLIVTDIFGAGESPIEGLSASALCQEIERLDGQTVSYVKRDEVKAHLKTKIKPQDIVLTLGAGDITNVASDMAH
ncbi:MAG: UDP-N-acetylmuramate--L-alanine ligase [Simkaniaceae bacterium]|nr:UDP-N-acetylmuramate--L-alanine ligase [Simkaniaceae bacterium]